MNSVRLIAHVDRVAGVCDPLVPPAEVGAIGKGVGDLPLAFVPKLGSYHNRRGHPNRRLNIAARLMVLWVAERATPDGGSALRSAIQCGGRRPRAITF